MNIYTFLYEIEDASRGYIPPQQTSYRGLIVWNEYRSLMSNTAGSLITQYYARYSCIFSTKCSFLFSRYESFIINSTERKGFVEGSKIRYKAENNFVVPK